LVRVVFHHESVPFGGAAGKDQFARGVVQHSGIMC
jgi:hypothetical protein